MAVYERSYRPYTGALTEQRGRFLVVPRYAYQQIFKSRGFIAFFVACFICPLILAVTIYMSYNLSFLKLIAEQSGMAVSEGKLFDFKFDGSFFLYGFTIPQFWMSFFMAFLVGPELVSADLKNNGMPLYLSRPFTRADYILGKLSVLVILLSSITWVPGLLLYALHGYLAGGGWLLENLRLAAAIFFGSVISIALLSLISLAISAYVKWKPLARLGLFAVFVVAAGLSNILNVLLRTEWGSLLNLGEMLGMVWANLFAVGSWRGLPPWTAWFSLLSACSFFLLLLVRRVRAYEVVR